MRTITTLSILILLLVSNDLFAAKKIRANGPYTHPGAHIIFPVNIDGYERTELNMFDHKNNLAGTYEAKDKYHTAITVYVYPNESSTNHSFREMYLASVNSILIALNKKEIERQNYINYKKDGYSVNGFQAYINLGKNGYTTMQLFECGGWYLKTRITSDNPDTAEISRLFARVTEVFSPEQLVKNAPFSLKSTIQVTPAALRDSSFLFCTFAGAINKIEWAIKHVDSMEMISGFPSLYLDMYTSSLINFANHYKGEEMQLTEYTQNLVNEINALTDAGFLDEYVMEQRSNIMYIPPDTSFDFEGYHNWLKAHSLEYSITDTMNDIVSLKPLKKK